MSIILDAFIAFFNCRQKDKEVHQDCTRRFKVAREIPNSHLGGEIILPKFVKSTINYNEKDADKLPSSPK